MAWASRSSRTAGWNTMACKRMRQGGGLFEFCLSVRFVIYFCLTRNFVTRNLDTTAPRPSSNAKVRGAKLFRKSSSVPGVQIRPPSDRLPPVSDRPPSLTLLGSDHPQTIAAPATFDLVLREIAAAKESIEIFMYVWRSDKIGNEVATVQKKEPGAV